MLCKNCGKIVPDDSKFCVDCGARIESPEVNTEDEFCYCTNCGNKIRKSDYMCNKCCVLTGVIGDPSSAIRKNRLPQVLLIISIVASVVGLRLIGAILSVIGLAMAINKKDKKIVRLGIVATVLCFVLCLLKLNLLRL